MTKPLTNPEKPTDDDYKKTKVFVPEEENNNTSACRDLFATGLGVITVITMAIIAIVIFV